MPYGYLWTGGVAEYLFNRNRPIAPPSLYLNPLLPQEYSPRKGCSNGTNTAAHVRHGV